MLLQVAAEVDGASRLNQILNAKGCNSSVRRGFSRNLDSEILSLRILTTWTGHAPKKHPDFHMSLSLSLYIYIYIYIYGCVCIYIYIYIYYTHVYVQEARLTERTS